MSCSTHTEFQQTGLQLCCDECINFLSLNVTRRKPRCEDILTNTTLFCPFDRLCVVSACCLHTCVDFHSLMSMSRCHGNHIVNMFVKIKLLCILTFVANIWLLKWQPLMTEINKSHQNLLYYYISRKKMFLCINVQLYSNYIVPF